MSKVTDEMVERGAQAAFEAGWPTPESQKLALKNNPEILAGYRKIVRAALEAALATQRGAEA